VSAILDQTLPSAAAGTALPFSGVSPGILYVDDDEMIRSICGEILLQAGYGVDLAGDGQAGWEALQHKKYELLITDHDMQLVAGLGLAACARAAGMELPIIIASGFVSFANDDPYAWLWRSSSLRKPFTPVELLQTVKAVLCAAPLADH
jgi:DNA-binding response OmpR family regulator